jgi:hypothetical protein
MIVDSAKAALQNSAKQYRVLTSTNGIYDDVSNLHHIRDNTNLFFVVQNTGLVFSRMTCFWDQNHVKNQVSIMAKF